MADLCHKPWNKDPVIKQPCELFLGGPKTPQPRIFQVYNTSLKLKADPVVNTLPETFPASKAPEK